MQKMCPSRNWPWWASGPLGVALNCIKPLGTENMNTLILLAIVVGLLVWANRSRPVGGRGGSHRRRRRGRRHCIWN